MHFDLKDLIQSVGYFGIFGIVFAESGLLIGALLPGDSLLFTAGFLASQDILSLTLLLVITFVAAVAGDSVGYATGARYGHRIFKKADSILFNHKHIERAEAFYKLHGGKALILARFMPIVRTIAPLLAGVGKMPYRKFVSFNIIGAFLWAVGITSLGYFLGKSIPDIDKYLLPAIVIILVVSIAPSVFHVLKDAEQRDKIKQALKRKK